MPEGEPRKDQPDSSTKRIRYMPPGKFPISPEQGKHGESSPAPKIPPLHGLDEEAQRWVKSFADGRGDRIRIFGIIAKLESIKIVRLVAKLRTDDKLAEALFEHIAKLNGQLAEETLLTILADSDIFKIEASVRGRVADKISRGDQAKSKLELPIGCEMLNLKDLPEGSEKEKLMSEAFSLMKRWHYPNIPTHVRADRGCLYHVPENIDEMRKRVHDARLCYAVLRESDGKLLAFTEFQEDKMTELSALGKIHATDADILRRTLRAARRGGVIHEQIVVSEGPKGAGPALVDHVIQLAKGLGFKIVTTEIQTRPPNSNSIRKHLEMGYREFGWYDDDRIATNDREEDKKSFTLYALAITDKAKAEFKTSMTESPTPKPDEESEEE